jgi:hypothetical protein
VIILFEGLRPLLEEPVFIVKDVVVTASGTFSPPPSSE